MIANCSRLSYDWKQEIEDMLRRELEIMDEDHAAKMRLLRQGR